MAIDGFDIGEWLTLGFEVSSQHLHPPLVITPNQSGMASPQERPTITDETSLCYACLNLDEPTQTPAYFVGPDDIMYCKSHYADLPSELHRADMEALAERYRQAFPGWKVTVEAR